MPPITMYPRFKVTKHPKYHGHFVMEDLLNGGPKYILHRKDLEEFRGHINLVLGEIKDEH